MKCIVGAPSTDSLRAKEDGGDTMRPLGRRISFVLGTLALCGLSRLAGDPAWDMPPAHREGRARPRSTKYATDGLRCACAERGAARG
jgi:hypothetical protein